MKNAATWDLFGEQGATDGRFALFVNGEPVEAHGPGECLSRPRVPSADEPHTLRDTSECIRGSPLPSPRHRRAGVRAVVRAESEGLPF